MSKNLYIYGAGGHAKVVAETARLCGYKIKGFWTDNSDDLNKEFCGSKIIAFSQVPLGANIFVAFGDNKIRFSRGKQLAKDFNFPNIVHPSSQIASSVKLGYGIYIAALVNIDPECSIGDFSIINNNANISHDANIGDGCHICGGTMLAGNVTIEDNCFIGIGSNIIEKITIGENSTLGAGATVINNLPSNIIAVGCPAKVIKKREERIKCQ